MKKELKNSVHVELHDWTLGKKEGEKIGRVVRTKSLDIDDLVRLVVARRTEFNATTIRAAFNLMKKMAMEQLMDGASVNFGLGHFQLKVNGIFNGENAQWDKDKHNLTFKFSPAKEMRNTLDNCDVKVLGKANSSIGINRVTDLVTKQVNKCLTPGGGVNVTGKRIKLAGDQKDVGIKLINCDTKDEIPISWSSIMQNTLSCIKFVAPTNHIPGQYQLLIVSQYTSKGFYLKEAKTYCFEYILEVR